MPLELIVEDGSLVDGANSYSSMDEIITYCALRGVTITNDDAGVIKAIKAMDYLETKDYLGKQVELTQSLSWPRKCVTYQDGTPFPDDEIPVNLKNAQCQLVIEQANGIDISPSVAGGPFVTREKVDVIEVDYAYKLGTEGPELPLVDAFLQGLLKHYSVLRSERV
jgi:hypothetical protein